ncbi:Metallo-beta-lactamase superfamily protein [Verrucomicrobium sp. GAS474]|uniref:hypothetical protein n=1 Tax=Verrucomicrobium sp. GAS474 TaxID=1882831 RepID=UPI00087B2372|nr:hypothetical protein [Verrucomicrobium sp. GAS474]SDU22257.1 Metallo-beta-lactamase superfamily protein [Verrucomicrobium sp. GAS474]
MKKVKEVRAESVEQVTPRLLFWSAYDPACKAVLCAKAWLGEKGWLFIDPIEADGEELEAALGGHPTFAVVLTNGNHARAAEGFRRRFGIPIHAHADAVEELGIVVDHPFAGEEAVGGLLAIPIPGGGAGETAFHAPDDGGVLFLGDAVINLEETGLALLPKKYCLNEKASRASLKQLLRLDFSLITFAHGTPLRIQAKERLRLLLNE